MSFGLEYAPGSSFKEVIALSSIAAKHKKLVAIHTRLSNPKDIDFSSLEKAAASLKQALERPPKNDLERDGVIQRFEYTFELCWKFIRRLLLAMGRKVQVLPMMSVEEGIRAARTIFPRAYFEQTKAARLIECLKRYKRVVNRKTNEPMGPLHDEYSHGADCWRYVAQAVDLMRSDGRKRQTVEPLLQPGGWMAN